MKKKLAIKSFNFFYGRLQKDVIEFEKVVGKKAIIKEIENQKGDVPVTLADITKATQNLGYNPKVKLEDGLRKTYQWIKLCK